MDWLKFSYHSPPLLYDSIIAFLTTGFLIFRKNKTLSTYWLAGFFLGDMLLFTAYFASFSIFADWGAFHRYVSCLVMFGNASLVAFSYYYPKTERPREAFVVTLLSFLVASLAYVHFIWNTWKMEKIYSFEAQIYTFDFGEEVGLVIMLLFLLALINLLRKTVRYSGYEGRFSSLLRRPVSIFSLQYPRFLFGKFLVGLIKIIKPVGKEAEAVRGFAIPVFAHILVALLNVFVKTDRISYELYSFLFATSTMFILYNMGTVYINNSTEPTTFRVKLVGISLGTILFFIGIVGNLTLYALEKDYDEKRLLELGMLKNSIQAGNFDRMGKNVKYVLSSSDLEGRYKKSYTILFEGEHGFTPEELLQSEAKEIAFKTRHLIPKLKKKLLGLSTEELEKIAFDSLNAITIQNEKRSFRKVGDRLYTAYRFEANEKVYEIGFDYSQYRSYIHDISKLLIATMLAATILILIFYPLLFSASLVKPLDALLEGVRSVNKGVLEIDIPIRVQDEIGYLSRSFNRMVKSIRLAKVKLEDYANNLEHKVQDRTKEVQARMEEIKALKEHQDGDYFLTSLLTKPLFINSNKSENVLTTFFIKQKKQFVFRNRQGELGGDLCVTGNLRLGKEYSYKRYIMAVNADAMGKSMQGAGGALVMGVVINSIMARSAANNRILDKTPEEWLKDTYNEIHSIFKSFDGSMVISATLFLISEETGKSYFINAEHPFTILYRDEKAEFIDDTIYIRKLGLDINNEFLIQEFQFKKGDVVFLGSDGRDDIRLDIDSRLINEDETLVLKHVEKAKGDLDLLITEIEKAGEITDDLSILRIEFLHPKVEETSEEDVITTYELSLNENYEKAKELVRQGDLENAKLLLEKESPSGINSFKVYRLLGLICLKLKEHDTCISSLNRALEQQADDLEIWYYLSVAYKRTKDYDKSIETSLKALDSKEHEIPVLLNLCDCYRLTGNTTKAVEYLALLDKKDPGNPLAEKIRQRL
ncbi:MAG: SpoIIE family protein phosphatase [Leptospiraceae bacterium]|nr:SpoIIE family protein phosphatase [Leptospiraceae bacterium]